MSLIIAYVGKKGCVMASDKRRIAYFGNNRQALEDELYNGSITTDDTSIAYDFTNATAELIAHFHGHLHNFRVEKLGENEITTITIPNACFDRNNEYGTHSDSEIRNLYGDADENGNQRQFNKTANTK